MLDVLKGLVYWVTIKGLTLASVTLLLDAFSIKTPWHGLYLSLPP